LRGEGSGGQPKRQRRGPPGGASKDPKTRRGDRRRESDLRGETISPGRRGLHNLEAGEEARNPTREGDLCGETPQPTYFKAPKVRGAGCARCSKAKGEGWPPGGGPAGLEGGRVPPTRSFQCFWCWDALTWLLGSRGPGSRALEPSGEGACPSLRVRTGHRIRGVGSECSRGAEAQESNGRRPGATRVGANGLAGGTRLRSR
jgi:hypothetical protein